ncbi:MAG: hypothetical protein HUU28_09305, partial [Planctomycetaceae bacterium]|nr:hypothetical protein [Planctomycetaceae bacterium]
MPSQSNLLCKPQPASAALPPTQAVVGRKDCSGSAFRRIGIFARMNRLLRLVPPFLSALLAACASERAAPAPKVAALVTPEASATAPKDDSVRSTP